MKKLSFLFIGICLVLFVGACGKGPKVATIGEAAPDFTLVDLNGKTWTLSELKGQVVFVNFWATWCPPCREEMPSMQKLYMSLPRDKFKMLAVLNKDKPEVARGFAAKRGITMPILDDQHNNVGPSYGLTGLPETFIIDKKGILREKFIGPAQWDSPAIVRMLTNYIRQ